MRAQIRGAPAGHPARARSIAVLLAASLTLILPAAAAAAVIPHFNALPISGNTELSVARDGIGMAALPGGRALIVGGFRPGGTVPTADIFDAATDTFTTLATQLHISRSGAAVAALPGGRVLIAGGTTSPDGSTFTTLQSAEVFDSTTQTFTLLTSTQLSTPRSGAVAAPLPDGRVLIAGGFGTTYLQSAELFDPVSDTFTALPASGSTQLQTARDNAVAVPLPGGKVLIAGGTGAAGVLANAEIFDPATEAFSALPAIGATELQTARTAPGAAALPDGRVLIVGGDTSASNGVTSADVLSSAELFDPASGTFSALPASGTTQLQNPRAYTAAAALGNGQILVAGGAGPDYLASAELATLPPSCSSSSASVPAGAANVRVALQCSGLSFTYAIAGSPSHGSLGGIDQAHAALTYTPDAGFSGQDSFTYLATNIAGASDPATAVVTVPGRPPSLSLQRVSLRGPSASLAITCRGAAGGTCTGTGTFRTRLTTVGSTPVRVAAPAAARRKPATRTVTVATARFSLQTGRKVEVPVTLNRTGKRLLSRFYRLPTRLAITGTTSVTRAVQFRYSVINARVVYGFGHYSSGDTTVLKLTAHTLPHRARVKLSCRGPGCPFSQRVFTAHTRLLALAREFGSAHLHPGAAVMLTVTAPRSVGEVDIYTMLRAGPRIAARCLPPGAKRPVVCA